LANETTPYNIAIENHHLLMGKSTISTGSFSIAILIPSGYDIHSLPWKKPPILKNGNPSISIRAMASMANC